MTIIINKNGAEKLGFTLPELDTWVLINFLSEEADKALAESRRHRALADIADDEGGAWRRHEEAESRAIAAFAAYNHVLSGIYKGWFDPQFAKQEEQS